MTNYWHIGCVFGFLVKTWAFIRHSINTLQFVVFASQEDLNGIFFELWPRLQSKKEGFEAPRNKNPRHFDLIDKTIWHISIALPVRVFFAGPCIDSSCSFPSRCWSLSADICRPQLTFLSHFSSFPKTLALAVHGAATFFVSRHLPRRWSWRAWWTCWEMQRFCGRLRASGLLQRMRKFFRCRLMHLRNYMATWRNSVWKLAWSWAKLWNWRSLLVGNRKVVKHCMTALPLISIWFWSHRLVWHLSLSVKPICVLEGELRLRFLMCVPFCFCLATDLRKILNPPNHVAELLQNYDAIGNKAVFGCKMSQYDQPCLGWSIET